jgi:hypothetical protein
MWTSYVCRVQCSSAAFYKSIRHNSCYAKATGGEGGYHATGELIVAPDRALVNPIGNLKRVVEACGDHSVFVISPHFRFVRGPCCYAAGHMTNFGDPGFIREMVKDLSRVFQLLKRSLPNVKVIEGMELICGKKYNLEKATAAATSCWTADVIHPTSHTYAKMALHLLKAIAPQDTARPSGPAQAGGARGGGSGGAGRKRTHSDCESETRNYGRHGERSRNWAELRRDQARSDPHFYPVSYRGTNNRGRGNFSGRNGGGGDDRNIQYGGGRGGRPYNRGWVPRGKRHHRSDSTWDLLDPFSKQSENQFYT